VRRHTKVRRLNLELGPKSYQALERLQASLETHSLTETIRIALQVLSRLFDAEQHGSKVFIERDGEKIEVLLPLVQSSDRSHP
jgi:hypothetical protein